MDKKTYSKPVVLTHELITFETGISNCIKIATVDDTHPPEKVCLRPDHTWSELP